MWGACAGEKAEGRRRACGCRWIKSQPGHWLTPQWTCMVISAVAALGPGVLVPGARGPGQGGPSSLGACPRRCGTLVAGAPFLSRSTVTTGGFWSGHSAFMTSAIYNPQPHATRTLLTQSLAAHGLRNPRLRRAGPARAPGAAPDPLPGQRRASDLTRLRSARSFYSHGPSTALPRLRGQVSLARTAALQ